MRNMSFAITTEQVRGRRKTVTRRLGWTDAKPGDIVQPVVKGQGLKKGERVETIGGPIRVVSVRVESLRRLIDVRIYGIAETVREGFPTMPAADFAAMFCQHNGCTLDTLVTRIEFEYVEPLEARS